MDVLLNDDFKEISLAVNKTLVVADDLSTPAELWRQGNLSQETLQCPLVMSLDYPDDVISREAVELIRKFKGAVLVPVIFAVGAATICLSLTVFWKHGLSRRINLCLFCLELVNLLNVTFLFVINIDDFYAPFGPGLFGPAFEYLMNHNVAGLFGFGYGAVFLSALVACERCIGVLFPLHSKTICSTRTMAVVIAVGTCFFSLPRFAVTARYRVVCAFDIRLGGNILRMTVSDFYFRFKGLVDVLDSVFYGIVVSIGGPIVTFIATLISVVKLNQAIAFRKFSSSSDTIREIALTKMMIILSLENVLFSLPAIILRIVPIFESEVRPSGRYSNTFTVLASFVEIATHINGSINFLVYYFAGTKFRTTIYSIFNCKSR